MRDKANTLYVLCGIFLALLSIFVTSCGKARDSVSNPTIVKTKHGIEMVLIPAGWFEMGSHKGEADESPVHKVWIDAFLMDRYEITQEQYSKLILGDPSHFKGPNNPVEQISWANAALYCNARSRAEGLEPCYNEDTGECNFQANGYRLPTEAEWEYACRAGTNTEYFFGRDSRKLKDYAWYVENSGDKTHPIGQRKPNPWGLYDMYGNVAEWCNDVYDEGYYKESPSANPRGPSKKGERYVLRGGSWNSSADTCRSASRIGEDPGFQDACFARDDIGFRCVRRAINTSMSAGVSSKDPESSNTQDQAIRTGFVYHDIYLQHKTGEDHPESPKRLEAIIAGLKKKGLLDGRSSSLLELAVHKPSPG